jgi:integrase
MRFVSSSNGIALNHDWLSTKRLSLGIGSLWNRSIYAPSTINLRLAAVRRLAYEASDSGLLSPDLAAGIRRVKGVRRLGVRIGNWLTAEEGRRLLSGAGNASLRGRRNYAMLSVLTGCGLRRAHAAALKIEDLQLREGHWVIANLNGKGGHIRTVPMPDWVKMAIDQWTVPASILSGTLFRSINKAGRVGGTGFTPKVIWSIVKDAASNTGLAGVAPHDLRRYAAWKTMPSRRPNGLWLADFLLDDSA